MKDKIIPINKVGFLHVNRNDFTFEISSISYADFLWNFRVKSSENINIPPLHVVQKFQSNLAVPTRKIRNRLTKAFSNSDGQWCKNSLRTQNQDYDLLFSILNLQVNQALQLLHCHQLLRDFPDKNIHTRQYAWSNKCKIAHAARQVKRTLTHMRSTLR